MTGTEKKPYRAMAMGLDGHQNYAIMVELDTAPEVWRPILATRGLNVSDSEFSQFIRDLVSVVDRNIQSDFGTKSSGKAGIPPVKTYGPDITSGLGERAVFGYSLQHEAAPLEGTQGWKEPGHRVDAAVERYVNDFIENRAKFQEVVKGLEFNSDAISPPGCEASFVPLSTVGASAKATVSGYVKPSGGRKY